MLYLSDTPVQHSTVLYLPMSERLYLSDLLDSRLQFVSYLPFVRLYPTNQSE
jgi:hypothetical protein